LSFSVVVLCMCAVFMLHLCFCAGFITGTCAVKPSP
jgi:hypothetical protein